jgi:hypothetical protein
MRRRHQAPSVPDIEALLAAERAFSSEPQELRNRVMRRASALLQHYTAVPLEIVAPRPRRLKLGLAALAAVMLTALCAVAFVAGYKTNRGGGPVSSAVQFIAPSDDVPPIPKASSSAAPIPSVDSLDLTPAAPGARISRSVPARQRDSAVTDSEALAAELRVLQPARQAVARRDFSSALARIAEHQRLYPWGTLTQEREALRIKALLGLGRRIEAERAGAAFRKRFPRSALNGRIEEMLGVKP